MPSPDKPVTIGGVIHHYDLGQLKNPPRKSKRVCIFYPFHIFLDLNEKERINGSGFSSPLVGLSRNPLKVTISASTGLHRPYET